VKVRFWGVRGSIPVAGPHINRYGGNTSCVEVRPHKGPLIIVDAGTGVRKLGKELMLGEFGRGEGVAHLLISHTHWDHIQGLPFFAPLYVKGNELFVYARQRDDTHMRAVFSSQTADPYFPVPFHSAQAKVTIRELLEGEHLAIGDVRVSSSRLNHPWVAMAYRIDADGGSVCYVSDTAPFGDILLEDEFIKTPPRPGEPLDPEVARKLGKMRDDLIALCRGADVAIFDAQFTPEEYRQKVHWGHSTPDDAIAIATEAGVKRLVLYHHDPARTDDEQDAILDRCRKGVNGRLDILAAHESMELTVGAE
jgi:phosphoribosyl 1,2-cyclic phosphodiesterase